MAVERVRLPLDLVARIGETRSGRGIDHALAISVVALDRAELGDEILLAADAFTRNPRIEEVGMEPHLYRNLRLERNRLLQEAFADVAPWAHYVGHDIDREGCGVAHEKTSRTGEDTIRLASAHRNLRVGSNPCHQRGEIVARREGGKRNGRLERLLASQHGVLE